VTKVKKQLHFSLQDCIFTLGNCIKENSELKMRLAMENEIFNKKLAMLF